MILKLKTTSVLRFLVFSVFCFLLGVQNPFAQPIQSVSSESPELRLSSIEQNYDSQIYEVLSNYFDRKKFFVDVSLDVEIAEQTVQSTPSTSGRSQSQNIMMPGLPFIPDDYTQRNTDITLSNSSASNEMIVRTMNLNSIRLNIYADTSFTPQELQFMELLAGTAGKINTLRGDVITVFPIPIPDISNSSGSGPEISITNQLPEFSWGTSNLLTFLPGLLLMLLLGVTILISRYQGKEKRPEMNPRTFRASVKEYAPSTPRGYYSSGSQTPADIYQPATTSPFETLVNTFFDEPGELARIFNYWISTEGKEGAAKSARVIACVDKKLIRLFKSELSPDQFSLLEYALYEVETIPLEERHQIIHKIVSLLNAKDDFILNDGNGSPFSLFRFLDNLSSDQLITLFRNEDPQHIALAVNFLDKEKAAVLMEEMGVEKASDVLLKITRIQNITPATKADIATELFNKSVDLLEQEKDNANKLDQILPILERLSVSGQHDFITQLKKTDPYMGSRIEKEFITFNQIPSVPDFVLTEAISDLNTEVMVDALIGADEYILDTLIPLRPKREQKLIRTEIAQSEENGFSSSEEARSILLNSIRRALKNNL